MKQATFAAGCFWCYEPLFESLKGVSDVDSGYVGGGEDHEKVTYEDIHYSGLDHAEGVNFEFNPEQISYEELVRVFFAIHDPTTRNKQGFDVGREYRSAIFYHDDEQKNIAEKVRNELDNSNAYDDPIVTEIVEFDRFYKAEDIHQNFYKENKGRPDYCRNIIDPKVKKFLERFKDKTKEESFISDK